MEKVQNNKGNIFSFKVQVGFTLMNLSILYFEKDNLLSLTNICKTYILNTKQIQTNSISGNVRDNLKTLSAHHDSKLNDL